MQILITELTEMGGGNFCVAGWDSVNARMIRPLPNGSNWPTAEIQKFGIAPGILMEFEDAAAPHPGHFPHSTEDTRVSAAANRGARPDLWIGANAPHTAGTVQQAFDGNVEWNSTFHGRKQGVHVAKGTNCRSLWGLSINSNNIDFIEEFHKLKCVIHDGDDEYVCAVSSTRLKSLFRDEGVIAVNNSIPPGRKIHMRLGLARAFGTHPDKCFLMVNGIQF